MWFFTLGLQCLVQEQGSGTKRKTLVHGNQASSSSGVRKQLNKNQTEEDFVGLKGDSYKNLPSSDKEVEVKPDNLDNSDSEATESDEDVYRAQQPFQHPPSQEIQGLKSN